MSTGIVLNSDNKDEQTLEIANSVVHNSSGDLITSNFNKLYVWNSEISDAGSAVVRLSGGEARFVHCTLTNYYFYDIIRDPILTLHYALPSEINDTIDAPLLKAEFANCLIYGKTSDINADDLTGSDVFLQPARTTTISSPPYGTANRCSKPWAKNTTITTTKSGRRNRMPFKKAIPSMPSRRSTTICTEYRVPRTKPPTSVPTSMSAIRPKNNRPHTYARQNRIRIQ